MPFENKEIGSTGTLATFLTILEDLKKRVQDVGQLGETFSVLDIFLKICAGFEPSTGIPTKISRFRLFFDKAFKIL